MRRVCETSHASAITMKDESRKGRKAFTGNLIAPTLSASLVLTSSNWPAFLLLPFILHPSSFIFSVWPPVILIIRDGWGINPRLPAQAEQDGDATVLANTPVP